MTRAVCVGLAAAVMIAAVRDTGDPFNVAGQARTRTSVAMKSAVVPLRFPDGTPTGFFVRGDDPSQQGGHTPCPPGCMELDAHEVLQSGDGKALYFHPGGGDYRDRIENGQHGHVAASDLQDVPAPKSQPINGKPAKVIPGSAYFITPTRIPHDLFYKPNAQNGQSGSSYATYGNPGYDKTEGRGDWTYINWSWVQNGRGSESPKNVCGGGGMVRLLGKRDAVFRACDVPAIVGYSYGADRAVNGRVTAIYGQTRMGPGESGSTVYGWLPHSYQKNGDIIVPCVRRSPGDVSAPPQQVKSADRMERMAMNLLSDEKQAEASADASCAALLKRYDAERDDAGRMEILTEMSRVDMPGTVSAILKLLENEKTPMVREQAIVLVGFMRSTPAMMKSAWAAMAADYKRSTDDRERLRTIEIVSNIPDGESVEFLRLMRTTGTKSMDEKFAVAEGVFKLSPRVQIDPALLRAVTAELQQLAERDGDESVRWRAVHLLAAAGQDNRAFLAALNTREKSPKMREFLAKVITPHAGE